MKQHLISIIGALIITLAVIAIFGWRTFTFTPVVHLGWQYVLGGGCCLVALFIAFLGWAICAVGARSDRWRDG